MAQHGEAIVQRLEHSNRHRDWGVRQAAVAALGKSPEAVKQHGGVIVRRLGDSDSSVRRAAVEALGTSSEAMKQHANIIVQGLVDMAKDAAKELARSGEGEKWLMDHPNAGWDEFENTFPTAPFDSPQKRLEDVFEAMGKDENYATVLERTMAIDPSLAKLTNKKGERYVDLATLECRRAMQRGLYLLGRFEVDDDQPRHISATAAVLAATDHQMAEIEQQSPVASQKPRRALKAMRESEPVLAELDGRIGVSGEYVIAVLGVYVDAEVDAETLAKIRTATSLLRGIEVTLTEGLTARLDSEIQRRSNANGDVARVQGYKFLIVLELAHRSLATTLLHEHIAGKDFALIRKIATDLAEALDHLHSKNRIHGDFKPLNAVRSGSKWLLIDMDVSCTLDKGFGNKAPSSAYCPPEMAEVMLKHPGRLGDYNPSVAFDLWSLGCVLFELVIERPLWLKDQSDNIQPEDLEKLACSPDDRALQQVIKTGLRRGDSRDASLKLKMAVQLLRKLLDPDWKKRMEHFDGPTGQWKGRPMQGVLRDPFFGKERTIDPPFPTLLIVTTADGEWKAVLDRLETPREVKIENIPVTIGKLGGRVAAVCKTEQGITQTYSVVLTLLRSDDLRDSVGLVFAIGFAWGAQPAAPKSDDGGEGRTGQRIGDVLVAVGCISAGHNKAANGQMEIRGPVQTTELADDVNFEELCRGWPRSQRHEGDPIPPRVHVGTMISLPTLINDAETARSLIHNSKIEMYNPIGGDMELYQIAEAAVKTGKRWLLAKAICDFAGLDGPKTKHDQPVAAAAAADFADWLLRQDIMNNYL